MDSPNAHDPPAQIDEFWESLSLQIPDSPRLNPLPDFGCIPMDLDLDMEAITDSTGMNEHDFDSNHDSSEQTLHEYKHNGLQTAENPHDKSVDLREQSSDQSQSLARYRPTSKIPSFEELHHLSTVELQDPPAGYMRFPGSFDLHGQRIPFQKVFNGPDQAISPSIHEPLWKQMLEYFQRWGFWLTHVKDDKRRAELAHMLDEKTAKIWQDGIARGYCKQPNAQKTCCPAHQLDASAPQLAKRLNTQVESRKKMVNTAKQPAPFACENSKHPYSITNSELERQGVTMEVVLSRITLENLKSGAQLLEEMCERVDRDHLVESDWKPAIGKLKFDPRHHNRNLLMYCLWEVQRCHGIIDQAKTQSSKATTTFQVRHAQKRIDIHQRRANEHLALAVELNERRTKDSSEESNSEESDTEIKNGRRNPSRLANPVPVIDVTSGEDVEETPAEDSESESSTATTVDRDSSETRVEPMQAEEQALPTGRELFMQAPMKWDVTPPTSENVWSSGEQAVRHGGEKRELLELDQGEEPSSKRVKFDDQPVIMTNHNGPASDNQVNRTRGFNFRYFSTTTDQERSIVDDMIQEYVQAIMQTKSARFGYYAVFTAGGNSLGKHLAHGIWDVQKKRRATDSEWFYQNSPRPENFRADFQPVWHDWGYSLLPPPAPKRSKVKTNSSVIKSFLAEDDYDHDGDIDIAASPSRNGRGGGNKRTRRDKTVKIKRRGYGYNHSQHATSSHSMDTDAKPQPRTPAVRLKRRARKDDTESDGDWSPYR